jgi:hypothetical protein
MEQHTSETNNDGFEILYQEQQHLEGQYSSLATQVQKLLKIVRYDEKEARVAEQKSSAELLQAVAANTELVSVVLQRMEEQQKDPLISNFYPIEKERRTKEVKENLKYVHFLSTLQQETTPVCSCGKHHGIRFIDSEGNVVTECCPVEWWVSQSRLAYEDGNLSGFITSTPLDKYIAPYRLKK